MRPFIKISSKIHSAVMMVSFLKDYKGKYAAPLSLISRKLKLSYRYLEQVAQGLKKENIIESYRGSAGGYRLKKKNVTVLEIIEAIEGPICVLECVGGKCSLEAKCPSKSIWPKLQKELIKTLANIKVV